MSARAEVQIVEGAGGSFGLWLLGLDGQPTERKPYAVCTDQDALNVWCDAYRAGRLRGQVDGAQAMYEHAAAGQRPRRRRGPARRAR